MINLRHELQTTHTASLPEGPIRTIPPEILEFILFHTDQIENVKVVSHNWNSLALSGFKNSKQKEINQTIRLITGQFNPRKYPKIRSYFAQLQDTYRSHIYKEDTCVKVKEIFLIFKSQVIYGLRKISVQKKNQIEVATELQLPNSMKNIFEIAIFNLKTIENIDLETFFTLLKSCQPLLQADRGKAVVHSANLTNLEFIKLLLTDGPISETYRGLSVLEATKNNNLEIVRVLLADGPISETYRGLSVLEAIKNNNSEIITLLLAERLLSAKYLKLVFWGAIKNSIWRIIAALGQGVTALFGYISEAATKLRLWIFTRRGN